MVWLDIYVWSELRRIRPKILLAFDIGVWICSLKIWARSDHFYTCTCWDVLWYGAGVCLTVRESVHKACKQDTDWTTLHNVNEHKHLGITLMSNGKWTSHIDNICNSAYKQINVLRKLKYTLNRETLLKIYNTFILPCFEYACEVWDGFGIRESEKMGKNSTWSWQNCNWLASFLKQGIDLL